MFTAARFFPTTQAPEQKSEDEGYSEQEVNAVYPCFCYLWVLNSLFLRQETYVILCILILYPDRRHFTVVERRGRVRGQTRVG